MEKISLSVPSKTFIIGEYFVLNRLGKALVMNTDPRFYLKAEKSDVFHHAFLENSPAQLFISSKKVLFDSSNLRLNFYDPHRGRGGLGASSAAFSLVAHLSVNEHFEGDFKVTRTDKSQFESRPLGDGCKRMSWVGIARQNEAKKRNLFNINEYFERDFNAARTLKSPFGTVPLDRSPFDWVTLYRDLVYASKLKAGKKHSKILLPSGADILSQISGKITYIDFGSKQLKVLDWPFSDLKGFIVRTGLKIATHTHLDDLEDTCLLDHEAWEQMSKQVDWAISSLLEKDSRGLCKAINAFGQTLLRKGLVNESVAEMVNQLTNFPEILAAKGCGALGADTILVLGDPEHSKIITHYLGALNLELIATTDSLSSGIKVDRKVSGAVGDV